MKYTVGISDVINAKEAATCLKAHLETIRRMARPGDIAGYKVGKDRQFHKNALLRWSEGQSSEL